MLCPILDDASGDLATAANIFRRLSGFARAAESATIGALSPDPQWLVDVRNTMKTGSQAAGDWYALSPAIVASIGTALADYQSLFDASVGQTGASTSAGDWVQILQALQTDAEGHATAIDAAQAKMDTIYQDLKKVHDSILATMNETWQEHDADYGALAATSYSIAGLYDQLDQLNVDMTAADMAAGKTLFQTIASVTIPVFQGVAESIPFVGIGLSVFSVGQSIYTMVVTDQAVTSTLNQLGTLLVQRDQEIQAIGATNAALALLQALRESYETASQHLPRMRALWTNEAAKLAIVAEAVAAGAVPAKLTELTGIAAAQSVWDQLGAIGLAMVNQPVEQTQTAVLTPNAATSSASA
jgi:hypothetical protein